MKKLIFLVSLLLFLGACSQHEDFTPDLPETAMSDPYTGTAHDIYVNVLTNHFGGYHKNKPNTRAEGAFSITPYIEEGDTLMYIVQYDKGWELYSASQATNMLIFSSDEGVFDIDDSKMPTGVKDLIKINCNNIREAKTISSDPHPSWINATVEDESLSQGFATLHSSNGTTTSLNVSDLPPGHWVLIDSEVISEQETLSPRLTQTRWDQITPWNTYSKYLLDTNNVLTPAYAGCSPVAISQYLYYTHFKDNVPKETVTSAVRTLNSQDFTFSGSSTTIWNSMAKNEYDSGLNETAIFIGYVGRRMNAKYGLDGTSVTDNNSLAFLKTTYGVNFSISSVDWTYLTSSIDKGYPVISKASTSKYTDGKPVENAPLGHLFLIEQYRTVNYVYKFTYGYDPDPWSGEGDNPWEEEERDEEGNIIEYKITKSETRNSTQSHIRMNWGWGYSSSNGLWYGPTDRQWNAGGYNFESGHWIYKRSDVN